jgi:hypothetical protein
LFSPFGEVGAKVGIMRRATVTITDEIQANLEAFIRQQDVSPPLTAILQAALQEFLARRGFLPGAKKLRITPATKGSGAKDVSVDHDRHLAGH